MIPKLPAVVQQVNGGVGTILSSGSTIATLSLSQPQVTAQLGDSDPGQLKAGQQALIANSDGTASYQGTVDSAASGNPPTVSIHTDKTLSASLVGSNVSVVITIKTTGESVLAVPVNALRTAPGGGDAVAVMAPTGEQIVPVKIGVTGDGYAQIVDPPRLVSEGARVVA